MTNRITIKLALVAVAAIVCTACHQRTASSQLGSRKLIFFDESPSVTKQQRQEWLKCEKTIVASLRSGDLLRIFAVHDRTGDAAPLLSAELPILPMRPTSTQLRAFKIARAQVMETASKVLEQAAASTHNVPATDIFSIFDRCRQRADSRPEAVFIFSDMLHSTKGFDMEKTPLDESRFGPFIELEGRRHNWDSKTLGGAAVFVVLPNVASGHSPVNSRVTLEKFYAAMISALGGKLERFETHLEKGDAL